jgi:hypothetical protein
MWNQSKAQNGTSSGSGGSAGEVATRTWTAIHSKARVAIRPSASRSLRPKLVEFFHSSPSR